MTDSTADTADIGAPRTSAEADDRRAKLLAGLDALRTRSPVNEMLSERTLFVIGAIAAPTGLLVILFGWFGASRTPFLFEQVPYLISGGLLGLGLCFLGGFFYFAHWMTELLREQRRQTELLLEAIRQTSDDETVRDAILALEHRLLEAAEPAPRRSTKRKAKPRSKRRASA